MALWLITEFMVEEWLAPTRDLCSLTGIARRLVQTTRDIWRQRRAMVEKRDGAITRKAWVIRVAVQIDEIIQGPGPRAAAMRVINHLAARGFREMAGEVEQATRAATWPAESSSTPQG